jgi:hypothetical protein
MAEAKATIKKCENASTMVGRMFTPAAALVLDPCLNAGSQGGSCAKAELGWR